MWVNKCPIFFPTKEIYKHFHVFIPPGMQVSCGQWRGGKSHEQLLGSDMDSPLSVLRPTVPQSQSARTRVRTVTAAQFLPKKEEDEKRREFTFWTSRCVKYYGTDVYIAYCLNPDSRCVTWLFLSESHLKFKESESLVKNTLSVN